MKIYVISKKNFLYWDEHVVDALNILGHEVKHFQINNRTFGIQFTRGILKGVLGKNKGNIISNEMIIKNLRKDIINFKPDLVFIPYAFFIPVEFYQMVSELPNKPKLFAWEGDGGSNNESHQECSPFIDILFETDKDYVKENKLNFKEIKHLPFCANINRYKALNLNRENKTYFCGDLGIGRDEIFSKLTNFDFVIKGKNWHKLSKKSDNFQITYNKIDIDEQIVDYNKYKAVLNKHQNVNHISALNMRTFEVPATKTLLINDYREGIETLFDIDKEILVYRNIEELIVILEKLKSNHKEFDTVIANGYKKVLNEHTYVDRMKEVLKYV
jgi:spore maturation protein CgeB